MSLLRRSPVVDLDAVSAALARVEDPELHQPLTDLGMLPEVDTGRDGTVRLTVRLTTAACPLRDELARRVTDAVRPVPGVREVAVTFTVMDDGERLALSRRLRQASTPAAARLGGTGRIYAVASGKGGVGKSTVTANLAVALAQAGRRVGVIDADVWGYSMPQLFGVRRAPVAIKGLMLPVEAHGVRLMSVGFLVDDGQPVIWRGPMLHKALEQFLTDVHWGDLDVLLVDLPPGTGDVALSLLELCPDAALLAVTTPQVAAETVAARVGRMARDAGVPVAGVIENMSAAVCDACGHHTALFGEGGGQRLADAVRAPLLGRVPLELALREAGDAGVPAVAGSAGGAAATELRRIAAALPATRRSLAGRPLPLSVVPKGG